MSSELDQAKKDVALYLRGGRLPDGRLGQACRILTQQAPDAIRHLRAGLLGSSRRPDVCMQFLENLAEFCDMSSRERLQEMPDPYAHVLSCQDCRETYRSVTRLEVWRKVGTVAATAAGLAETVWREMTTSFQIAVDKVGGLLTLDPESDLAFGRPVPVLGGVPMSAPPERMSLIQVSGELAGQESGLLRKEWTVPDDETGYAFHFCSRVKPGSEVSILEIDVVEATGRTVPHTEIGLEVVNEDTNRTLASCPLVDFDEIPLELPVGRWRMKFLYGRPPKVFKWEFRLEVLPRSHGGTP